MTRRRARVGVPTLVALLGLLATACSQDTDSGQPAAEPTRDATQASGSPSDWQPVPVSGDLLPAGRLGMTANGRPDTPWAVVDVPENFSTLDGWVIFDESADGGGGIGYWTVSDVVREPCSTSPHPMPAGDTVDEVVAAFQKQQGTQVTRPLPVEVDGYEGQSFAVAVPSTFDASNCTDESFLWEADPAGARHVEGPGQFDKLWVLDVDGEVVVLTVTGNLQESKPDVPRLSAMVESAEFVPRA